MPYRICKTFEIENGHMLSKHPELCKFPHGHSRKVEFVIEADALDRNEMVCDFKVIKETMDEFLKSWDHAMCINTRDPQYAYFKVTYGDRVISFDNQDPTTEVMAKAIFDTFGQQLSKYVSQPGARYPIGTRVRIVKVRLWETSTAWAEYSEDKA